MVSEGLHAGELNVSEEDLRRKLMEALEGLHKGSVAVLESWCESLEGFESLREESIVVFTVFVALN